MSENESFVLTRDVNIVTIPDGTPDTLKKGETATIHQSLGNNYTVITGYGHMVRIAGADADALGKEASLDLFPASTYVDITGPSKGKGFAGVAGAGKTCDITVGTGQ